jgi:hypothetical protein
VPRPVFEHRRRSREIITIDVLLSLAHRGRILYVVTTDCDTMKSESSSVCFSILLSVSTALTL